jgi:hypothetical protein
MATLLDALIDKQMSGFAFMKLTCSHVAVAIVAAVKLAAFANERRGFVSFANEQCISFVHC